jgi:hypothetical protein
MANDADYGFMIWDGNSKGALNNISNLLKIKKTVLVYLDSKKDFYMLCTFDELAKLLRIVKEKT